MKFDFEPTGIRRHVDPVGRVVIPKEYRDTYGIDEGVGLQVFADKHGNILLVPEREDKA